MPRSKLLPPRAAILRFVLGASVPVLAAVLWSLFVTYDVQKRLPEAGNIFLLAIPMAALTAGYASASRAMLPHLRADAAITGRRGIVAGVAAAGLFVTLPMFYSTAPFINMIGGIPYAWVAVVSVLEMLPSALLSGAVAALALFFPWLQTSRASESDSTASADVALLAESALEPLAPPRATEHVAR